eukprot:scaffold648447_cov50-Prasinocladus_malaysianus.AAC.1
MRSSGMASNMWKWAKQTVLMRPTLEVKFSRLVFSVLCAAAEESTLDEYWLEVLHKVLLGYNDKWNNKDL